MTSRRNWIVPGIVLAAAAAGVLLLRVNPDVPRGDEGPSFAAAASPGGARTAPVLPATADSPAAPQREPAGSDADSDAATHLAERMAKLVRDLEYTPGLPEPVQQTVQPQPEPWRADPEREGPSPVVEGVSPPRIGTAGGDRVTIRGRNLRVVQVMFGSAPGKLLGASGNEVAVEAPPSPPGPVTIAVTNDDGTWALAPEPIAYAD